MAIFTAIASAIVAAVGITGTAAVIATAVLASTMAIGVSMLIGPRTPGGMNQQQDTVTGGRIQLPPATNNKLPVVYGSAFVGGSVVDAKISTDLQTMWYVIAMSEVTDTGSMTFDEVYYDNKLVTYGTDGAVASLTTNTQGGGEIDTKVNGYLWIYTFPNGSSSGTNTGGLTAIQIMSDAQIPVDQRWTSAIYTDNGQSADMTDTAFVIVKVKYSQDAGTTSLGAVTAKLTNSLTKPGDCIKDYLNNDRYGCGIPLTQIDTSSLTDLNTYSDLPCYYTPEGGGSLTSQPRYRFNGPIDTTNTCLSNLQDMVDACDSWMQYSELTGQWKVVINKAYDEAPNSQTINDLYSVTSDNLIGGINVTPTDLNQTYNQIEFQYPNKNIKDQSDFVFIALQDDYPSLLSENEPLNKFTMKNDLVNNFVQAKFIAIRRILQAREDLIISFNTDYSGIQVNAGDVIRVTQDEYGWTDKLFRVSNVTEEKTQDGFLGTRMTAFEYNGSIYDDDLDITDFVPEANTGLQNPNIISIPDAPTVSVNTANTLVTMNVTGTVPTTGLVRQLDFNYGTSSNTATHTYYASKTNSNGAPLTSGATYTININNLPAGNLYWSVRATNDFVGRTSNSSSVTNWPGANVTVYDPGSNTGGLTGNNFQPGTLNSNLFAPGISFIDVVSTLPTCNAATAGRVVYLTTDNQLYSCDGTNFTRVVSNVNLSGNIIASQISNVFASSVFGTLSNANVPNANIIGQIVEAQIQDAAISQTKLAADSVVANKIAADAVTTNKILAGAVTASKIQSQTITATQIAANTITGDQIAANSIYGNRIVALSITANEMAADSITANKIAADAVTTNKIQAGAVTAGKITVTDLSAISANVGTITAGVIRAPDSTFDLQLQAPGGPFWRATNFTNMLIAGWGIGSSSQYLQWAGPYYANVNNAGVNDTNAKFYIKFNGDAYFSGTLGANIITATNIISNSITSTSTQTLGSSVSWTGFTTPTIISKTVTVSNGWIDINSYLNVSFINPSWGVQFDLYRDATLIDSTGLYALSSASQFFSGAYTYREKPGAGTYTYSIVGKINPYTSSTVNVTVNKATLQIVDNKTEL